MAEIKTLLIRDLDDSFQIRYNTHDEKVEEYAEIMTDHGGWGPFPPIDVVLIDNKYKISDGIHRFNAAKMAGLEKVPCNVTIGTILDLLKGAYVKNRLQGLGWPLPDRKHGLRLALELYAAGELGKTTKKEIHEITGESERTIGRRMKEMEAEGFRFPETSIGADGKERPTKYQKSTSANAEVQTPAIPHEYCAAGCGTPIWDDIKEAKDCAYVQWDGKWFCSEECAQAYLAKQPEPQEPPDEDDDEYEDEEPVYVTCPKCGKRELEKNLHRAGWIHKKEEGHYGKDIWYCSKECRDWMKGLMDESWKTEEPPAREPAPSSSQASGAEPEQEEPDEFTFTDVDEETLPVCTEEHKETDELETQIVVRVRTKAFKTAQEFVNSLSVIDGKFQIHLFGSDVDAEFLGLYENNNLINNNINTNPEIFTDFYVCCKSKKGREVKLFISKAKYAQWTRKFGPTFDIDQNLRECCDYYNELTGSEMLSAGGVYSKVYAWLLKNWKAQQKQSKPKQNAYKDAGLQFDPSRY